MTGQGLGEKMTILWSHHCQNPEGTQHIKDKEFLLIKEYLTVKIKTNCISYHLQYS